MDDSRIALSDRVIMVCRVTLFVLAVLLQRDSTSGQEQVAKKKIRKLAPGVETYVPLKRAEDETNAEHDIVEVIVGHTEREWSPEEFESSATLFAQSEKILFHRGIWQFQFVHKPLRMIEVDIPQPDGKMRRKKIWYLMYRIINPGKHLTPVRGNEKVLPSGEILHKGQYDTIKAVDRYEEMVSNIGPHRFVPTFLLRTFENAELKINEKTVQYMDQIIPAAREKIYRRERPPCSFDEFYDSSRMSAAPIPVSTGRDEISRWGVATWSDIDPEIDFLTIQIMGLTNAYRWVDPQGAFQKGKPPTTGRKYEYKTLQLNFHRPGDALDEREDEIRLGVEGHPKYQWIFRPTPNTFEPVHPRF